MAKDICELYVDAVTRAYLAAKVTRLDQLRGTRLSTYSSEGLHLWSEAMGRVRALEKADPSLREVAPELQELRDAAHEDAVAEYLDYMRPAA